MLGRLFNHQEISQRRSQPRSTGCLGPGWRRLVQGYGTRLLVLLLLIVFAAGAAWWGFESYRKIRVERAALVGLFGEAKIQQDSGHYVEAWKLLEQARSLAPENPEVRENEAKLAMVWLENARVTGGQGSFWQLWTEVLPALSKCSVSPNKRQRRQLLWPTWAGEIFSSHARVREDSGRSNFISGHSPSIPRTHTPMRCGDFASWSRTARWTDAKRTFRACACQWPGTPVRPPACKLLPYCIIRLNASKMR